MTTKISNIRREFSSEINAWWCLVSLNEFLQKLRTSNLSQQDNINVSLILNSATVIEGLVYETISKSFGRFENRDSLHNRLMVEFSDRIEKSSWTDLQNIYKIVFDNELSKVVTQDIWRNTQSLFDFRNMIVHGKSLNISIILKNDDKTTETKIYGKYKKIYDFLVNEKKVVNKSSIGRDGYPIITLINNDSGDFYWETAREFIKIFSSRHIDVTKIILEHINKELSKKILIEDL